MWPTYNSEPLGCDRVLPTWTLRQQINYAIQYPAWRHWHQSRLCTAKWPTSQRLRQLPATNDAYKFSSLSSDHQWLEPVANAHHRPPDPSWMPSHTPDVQLDPQLPDLDFNMYYLHWTEVLSSHFSISFFLTQPKWYWNEFLLKYVHWLSGVLEKFSITSRFLGSKMQKSTFWRKQAFWVQLYWIQVQVVANLPIVDLKNTKHLTFCLWQIFYEFIKNDKFLNFPKFSEIISFTY